jgi:hypothetical protein
MVLSLSLSLVLCRTSGIIVPFPRIACIWNRMHLEMCETGGEVSSLAAGALLECADAHVMIVFRGRSWCIMNPRPFALGIARPCGIPFLHI